MVLKDKIQVYGLVSGARKFGGATKLETGEIYSFINKGTNIVTNGEFNVIFHVPITLGFNKELTRMTAIVLGMNHGLFKGNFKTESAKGSWFNQENEQIVMDDLLLFKFKSNDSKIDSMLKFADELRIVLNQEAICFEVNNQMVIV